MKITALIKELEKALEIHDDLEVIVQGHGYDSEPGLVKNISFNDKHYETYAEKGKKTYLLLSV